MYKRVLQKLNQLDIDAYLIQSEGNRNFLCNKGNYCLPGNMLITKNEVYLATNSRNVDYFKEIYHEYHVIKGTVNHLAEICQKLKIKSLGYESNITSKSQYDQLKLLFKNIDIIDMPNFIEEIRMIKTADEIKLLQDATDVSDNAYIEFLNYIKTGQTEAQARNIFNDIMMKNGAEGFSFETLLSSGKRSFMPHSAPTDKVIARGDLVLMDFGIKRMGYCSDTSRTIVMGKANETQKEMYNLVLKAQKHALAHIKAQMLAKDADALARDMISQAIPEGCYDYSLGHGIGMQVHEMPILHPSSSFVLQENMAVSVEPGVYIKGWGGIRIEDILIIKNKKGINLTKAPKELLEI